MISNHLHPTPSATATTATAAAAATTTSMSFVFSWDKLDDEVAQQLQEMIHNHFQRIPKPNFIGSLSVSNFRLGSTPPSVTVLDITDPLEEWYLDMDREEARLAKEAAEAGGGESMDEENMVSDEDNNDDSYEDDDSEEVEDEGPSVRSRHYDYDRQQGRLRGGRRQRRRRLSLTDEEGLVMVGESEVIEYLDSDDFDHERRPYGREDESPERPWRPRRTSAVTDASEARPYWVSRQGGQSSREMGVGGEEDHMRPDFFRSAIASPNVISPAGSSDSSFSLSGSADGKAISTSSTTAIGGNSNAKKLSQQSIWIDEEVRSSRVTSQLSMSPHPSDDDIESQALYTQGESTIYQQLHKLNINSTPTVLEGIQPLEDLESPDGGLPFHTDEMAASLTSGGEEGSHSMGTSHMIYSPLLSPTGSNQPLGNIHGVVGVGNLQSRATRTFSMSSAATAASVTSPKSGAEPPMSPLPATLLSHDYHGFGSSTSLVGLGRKQLGVSTVYSPRSGGATPVGFESPIASLSRRQSVSDANKDTINNAGNQGEPHQGKREVFESPLEAQPAAFKPVSHQNLDIHQRQHPPVPRPETRSTPASVFSSKESKSSSMSAAGFLDRPSGSDEASANTKPARRRAGTGIWSALSPTLSGFGLSSKANSVASSDSRKSGSQQDPKEKPSLELRGDLLEDEANQKIPRWTKGYQQQTRGSSIHDTTNAANSELFSKQPRNPQRPRSSQKSASSVNGWDDDREGNPYRRFGDGYIVDEDGNNDSRRSQQPHHTSKGSSRQSKEQGAQDPQQQLRTRRRHRRRRARSPTRVPSPILPGSSKRNENDLQLLLNVQYQGQMGFTIETELLLNYPTFAFLALPIKLTITSFSFKAKVLMAYLRDHVNVCFLEPEDPNDQILSNVRFQSQVGDEQKQAVLKNVTKVEHFVVDQLRKFIMEDFVYPSYHSIQLIRPPPPQQQQQQQEPSPAPHTFHPNVGLEDDSESQHNRNRRRASATPSSSTSSHTRSRGASSSILPQPSTIPSARTTSTSSTKLPSSSMEYGLHRRHRA
ncbi:Mitochondrial distribution and morphology protein 12 [Actinomortierella wolfii]|nr:Mitochondrial distribution and morphology protein 12 [Actinomortierella wolfii]